MADSGSSLAAALADIDRFTEQHMPPWSVIVAAARRSLRLSKIPCENCQGDPHVDEGGEVTPIQLTDLRVVERYNRDTASGMNKTRYASESDLLSVLTDEALLGELVKRGVLHRRSSGRLVSTDAYERSQRKRSDDEHRQDAG